jgi:hypothetical protein
MHLPSSQQMKMQVIYGLTAVGTVVDDDAKTVVEALLLSDFFGCGEELTENLVGGWGVRERRIVLFGDDQQVHWGLWINVRKREHGLVFVEACDRDHIAGDLAEEAVRGSSHERMLNLRGYFLKYLGSIPGIHGL